MPFQFKSKPSHKFAPSANSKTNDETPQNAVESTVTAQDSHLVKIHDLDGVNQIANSDANGATLVVVDVTNCRLLFPLRAKTVHLRRVRNSTLVFLPIYTSILMDECSEVILVAASQQLRVHSSSRLTLFAHAETAVIIEDCSDVKMGPYRLDDASLNCLRQQFSDDESKRYVNETSSWSTCAEPRDFDCVVGTSPNWSRLDPSQWKTFSVLNLNA